MDHAVQLGERDVRAVLRAAGELAAGESEPVGGPNVAALLHAVGRLVPCDVVSWSRIDLTASEDVGRTVELSYMCTVEEDRRLDDPWWAHHTEHPLWDASGSAVLRTSDVASSSAWHSTAFYQEVSHPAGLEHDLRVSLAHPPGQTHVVLLGRGPGRDFDARDCLVLMLLRPHLQAALRRATSAPRLTPREAAVMALVRDGCTNEEVARWLHVSPGTVRTHLQHVFTRLGVHTRTAAVAAVAHQLTPGS